jgi:hypothetical protein
MLEKLNRVRAVHGLGAVRPALRLRLAALRHSDDMVSRDFFSHTSPGGGTLFDRIARRHQPRLRPVPRPHRRLRLDGRPGQALVDRDSPSAGRRAGAGGPADATQTATATESTATAA